MAILTLSEFEAVIDNLLIRVEKEIVARGSVPPLETARDDLRRLRGATRTPARIKEMRAKVEAATGALSDEIPNDSWVLESMWDVVDYIDYRVT